MKESTTIINNKIIIIPKGSCLAQELERELKKRFICCDLLNADEILQKSKKINNIHVVDFSSATSIAANYNLMKILHQNKKLKRYYYAGSVSTSKKFRDIGDKLQIESNLIRRKNNTLIRNSIFNFTTELKIPLVPCRKDSLLWRFYRGEIEQQDLFNKKLVIPWLSLTDFIQELSSYIQQEIIQPSKINKIKKFKNKKSSIETLWSSLGNSTEFID